MSNNPFDFVIGVYIVVGVLLLLGVITTVTEESSNKRRNTN